MQAVWMYNSLCTLSEKNVSEILQEIQNEEKYNQDTNDHVNSLEIVNSIEINSIVRR